MSDDTTELEQLRRWKAEAMPVLSGLQELGLALGLTPGSQITGAAAAAAAWELRQKADNQTCYDFDVDRILKFKDGDTFDCVVSRDIGFHVRAQASITVRVLNIDTYELHKGSEADKKIARAAAAFTEKWLKDWQGAVRVRTTKEDGFGRWLGEVYVQHGEYRTTLADELFKAGFQKPGSNWGPQT